MAEGLAIKFLETTSAKLSLLPLVNGRFVFCTDTGAFYRETSTYRFLLSHIGSAMSAVVNNSKTLSLQTNVPMSVSGNRFTMTTTNTNVAIKIVPNRKDLNNSIEFVPNA